jgi:hypothetical protein
MDHAVISSHIEICSHIRLNRRRGHAKNNGMIRFKTLEEVKMCPK